jgi:hypothetical protein
LCRPSVKILQELRCAALEGIGAGHARNAPLQRDAVRCLWPGFGIGDSGGGREESWCGIDLERTPPFVVAPKRLPFTFMARLGGYAGQRRPPDTGPALLRPHVRLEVHA